MSASVSPGASSFAVSVAPLPSVEITGSPPPVVQLVGAVPGPAGPAGAQGVSSGATIATANALISALGVVIDRPGYLISVTVTSRGADELILTDGSPGIPVAVVGANLPLGDLALFQPKRFTTTLVAIASGPNPPIVAVGYA